MVEQATHKFLTYLLTELATQDLIKCCLSKDNQLKITSLFISKESMFHSRDPMPS